MARQALHHYSTRDMTFRSVSNEDATDFAEAVHDLDAAKTLFIVLFIAPEIAMKAHNAHDRSVAGDATGQRQSPSTSSPYRQMPDEVRRLGINATNLFGFWDGIGARCGRRSERHSAF
jgi:glucose-6-phosphate isomerase